jgi:type I restriction enzyme M protein
MSSSRVDAGPENSSSPTGTRTNIQNNLEISRTNASKDTMTNQKTTNLSAFIWSIAELLRGDAKPSEYAKIILPFVVLRRLDCVLAPTKDAVIKAAENQSENMDEEMRERELTSIVGPRAKIYNRSHFTFETLRGQDADQLRENLMDYITKFSANARDIFIDKFGFPAQLKALDEAGILYLVFERFCQIDLHPDNISNIEMGQLFEDLIRRFNESSAADNGDYFTPREVIRLMVELLLAYDHEALSGSGVIRTIYDPTIGTGGMASIGEEEMRALNEKIRVRIFGQEMIKESYAICKSDMLITGHDPENIAFGNTLTDDAFPAHKFHYMLSNPPYGVDWKKSKDKVTEEYETQGMDGRFGAGLPSISDGQLLFVQHMVSKMRPDEQGSRIGIVMNGSPLFSGGAGSGESEIRRWLLENDLIEAIIALPTDIFYNTGIQTYVWLLSNKKVEERKGKVQLIDSSGERFWRPTRRSLGAKRREIPDEARQEIVSIYHDMLNGGSDHSEVSKIFDTTAFGFRKIRVERPLRLRFEATEEAMAVLTAAKPVEKLDENTRAVVLAAVATACGDAPIVDRVVFRNTLRGALKKANVKVGAPVQKAIEAAIGTPDEEAAICLDKDGKPEPDPQLRDFEVVPMAEDWREYVAREVTPFVPDAWVDETYRDDKDGNVGRVGYDINFNRYFYRYSPPRPVVEIDNDLKSLEAEIANLLAEVVE